MDSPETVKKIFKITGISSDVDESEDMVINGIDNKCDDNDNSSELLIDDTIQIKLLALKLHVIKILY
jgi:hypothetical protein